MRRVYTACMSNIEKQALGSFCWIELATPDQKAAKSFYEALFGWQANDMPMGPDDFYSIFRLEGCDAAASYTLQPDQRSRGVPPHMQASYELRKAENEIGAKLSSTKPTDVNGAPESRPRRKPQGLPESARGACYKQLPR
jgi:predicted enzyme related to lactoylglutathione lyase